MAFRRGLIAFVWLVALHAGCAKGMPSGDGDDTGDDTGDTGDSTGDDTALPDAGGVDVPDAAGHVDPPDAGDDGGGPVTITHSSSMALEAETGITCQSAFGNVRNSWYRVFDLPAMGITGALAVNTVTIGIQEAVAGGSSQPLTVILHRLQGDFVVANLSELGRKRINVQDGTLQTIAVPLSASVPAGATLVAEMMIPNGELDGNSLFPGANNDGQTGPTYVRSECGGANQPTDAADVGFPDFHLVLAIDAVEE